MLAHRGALLRHGAALGRRLGPAAPARGAGRLQPRRSKYVDARAQNASPTLGIAQFVALAPVGVLGAGIGACYASEGVRDAMDERFPKIMGQLRRVLPGFPAAKEAPPAERDFTREFRGSPTQAVQETTKEVQEVYAAPADGPAAAAADANAAAAETTAADALDAAADAAATEVADTYAAAVDAVNAGQSAVGPDGGGGGGASAVDMAAAAVASAEANDTEGEEEDDSATEDDDAAGASAAPVAVEDEGAAPDDDAPVGGVDASVPSDGDTQDSADDVQADKEEGDAAAAAAPAADAPEEADSVEAEEVAPAGVDPLELGDVDPSGRLSVAAAAAAAAVATAGDGGEAAAALDVRREIDAIDGRASQRAYNVVSKVLTEQRAGDLGADLDGVEDPLTLKRRIRVLEQLQQERSMNEATRIHESLRQQKAELDEEYAALVDARARELRAQHQAELESLDAEVNEELKAEVARIKEEYNRKMRAGARLFTESKVKEMQEILEAQQTQLMQQAAEEQAARAASIQELRMKVAEMEHIAVFHKNYDSITRDTHRRSFAAFKVQETLESGQPLAAPLGELREGLEVNDDALLIAALDAVPERARVDGVPTAMELQRQFTETKESALAAALAPKDGGLLGRAYSHFFKALLIRPTASATAHGQFYDPEAPTAMERLERAHYLLDQGDLHGCAEQVNMVLAENENTAVVEVLGGWLEQARARCLVQQAVKILQARAATVAETLV